jgi:hypothetical protein
MNRRRDDRPLPQHASFNWNPGELVRGPARTRATAGIPNGALPAHPATAERPPAALSVDPERAAS